MSYLQSSLSFAFYRTGTVSDGGTQMDKKYMAKWKYILMGK